jgi:polyisoprenoid-binding protein YceI
MALRARTHLRGVTSSVALLALAGTALVSASAADASAKKPRTDTSPTIRHVSPKEIVIGQTLTIRGRHFKPGRGKTSVAFQRAGGKVVFAKADLSTTKLIRVTVPASLTAQLTQLAGAATPTRFRLRVLAGKFGKRFTTAKLSP